MFCLDIQELLESNVGRARGKRLVIVSSCIVHDFLENLKELISTNDFVVKTCPEMHHINIIGYKIASFISYSNLKDVSVISVDGSPHCIQLHYIVEDIRNHFIEFNAEHYVFKRGKITRISPEVVKLSRHLARLQKIISSKQNV